MDDVTFICIAYLVTLHFQIMG